MGRHLRHFGVVIGALALGLSALSGAPHAAAQQSTHKIQVAPIDDVVTGVGPAGGGEWSDGATITLEIDDPDIGTGIDYTAQTTADSSQDPNVAFRFALAGVFDIQPGHVVTVTDGTNTATHVVTDLTVTAVDQNADTVTGTAAAGSEIGVGVFAPAGPSRNVVAEGGNWTADFSGLFDIQAGSGGFAIQNDNDGDQTLVFWSVSPPPPPPTSATVTGTVLNGAGQVPGPTAGGVACPGEWTFGPGVPPSPPCVFGFANGATGQYTIGGLAPGTWTIGAFGTAGTATVGAGTPQTLNLPAGTTSGINFVLGSRIQGNVTDPDSNPVAGVTVDVVSGAPIGGRLTTTDNNGDYTTPYLGAGTYGLRFLGPDGLLFAEAMVSVGVNQTVARNVQLQLGTKIQGSVHGDGNTVLPNSGAGLCPGTEASPTCPGLRIVNADANGNFVIPGVPAGTYTVAGVKFGNPITTSPPVVITTAPGDIVTCAFTIGTNSSSACSGAQSGTTVAEQAGAGETVTTDTGGTGATETDPVQAAVTTPSAGLVTIAPEETVPPEELPPDIMEDGFSISAPDATPENPLVLVFRVDASEIPTGQDYTNVLVFKNWVEVPACTGPAGQAVPDPCVSNRAPLGDGDAEVTVLSSTASVWALGFLSYDFDGFFAPVNNPPTLNAVSAGRAIPVKFSLGGDFGLDVFAAGYPKSQQINCDDNAPIDTIEETVTAGESSLSYDAATGTYTYVWKTNKAWSNTCRQLVVKLADGTIHRANFEFK
jgi:Carboxypeptidase regulatory-like domain